MSERYRIHAYVCDGGSCVREVNTLGTVPYDKVFEHLPDGCRYAVVSHYSLAKRASVYALLDLWDTLVQEGTGRLLPPKPILVTDCVDVAIMHATLLYGEQVA